MTRSARRLRKQVKDTVSELPIHAARLAVMGVGRALLLTDRVRKDYRDVRESGLGPVLGRLKNDAESITGMVVGRFSGNGNGKGQGQEDAKARADDSEISVGKPKPAAAARPPATPPKPPAAPPKRPAATKPTTPKPATKPVSKPAATPAEPPTAKPATKPAAKPAAEPTAEPAEEPAAKATTKPTAKAKSAANLPIMGYDEASLASVRARLRNLSAKQVAELRDYERANAARADFLRMYENRIAKLKAGG